MHCVASNFGYPNYRWSQLVRIIDVPLYYNSHIEDWLLSKLYIKFSSYLTDNTLTLRFEN